MCVCGEGGEREGRSAEPSVTRATLVTATSEEPLLHLTTESHEKKRNHCSANDKTFTWFFAGVIAPLVVQSTDEAKEPPSHTTPLVVKAPQTTRTGTPLAGLRSKCKTTSLPHKRSHMRLHASVRVCTAGLRTHMHERRVSACLAGHPTPTRATLQRDLRSKILCKQNGPTITTITISIQRRVFFT